MQQNLINENLLASWKEFYARYFNLRVDLDQNIIPDYPPGHHRLIVVVPKINPDRVIRAMRIRFTKVRTEISDIARIIISDDRSASEFPYAIWVKDEDNPIWDYSQPSEQPLFFATLLEYLLHFFKTWDETGRALNVETSMLCTGTKMVDGFPLLRFYPDIEELKITTFKEGDDSSGCHPRSVILKK